MSLFHHQSDDGDKEIERPSKKCSCKTAENKTGFTYFLLLICNIKLWIPFWLNYHCLIHWNVKSFLVVLHFHLNIISRASWILKSYCCHVEICSAALPSVHKFQMLSQTSPPDDVSMKIKALLEISFILHSLENDFQKYRINLCFAMQINLHHFRN